MLGASLRAILGDADGSMVGAMVGSPGLGSEDVYSEGMKD